MRSAILTSSLFFVPYFFLSVSSQAQVSSGQRNCDEIQRQHPCVGEGPRIADADQLIGLMPCISKKHLATYGKQHAIKGEARMNWCTCCFGCVFPGRQHSLVVMQVASTYLEDDGEYEFASIQDARSSRFPAHVYLAASGLSGEWPAYTTGLPLTARHFFKYYAQVGFERISVYEVESGDIACGPDHIGICLRSDESDDVVVCHASGSHKGSLQLTSLDYLFENQSYVLLHKQDGFPGVDNDLETHERGFIISTEPYDGQDLQGSKFLAKIIARKSGDGRAADTSVGSELKLNHDSYEKVVFKLANRIIREK